MDPALPGLIGLLILILLSFYLTAARTALGSARRQSLRERAEKGDQQALLAANTAEDSSRVLNTFHLSNVLVHFLVASTAISLFLPLVAPPLSAWLPTHPAVSLVLSYLAIAVPTALVVYILTELLPEAIVHADPDRWAISLARPAQITINLMWPLVVLLGWIRHAIIVPLGLSNENAQVTEEEIMTLVDAGEEEGSIQLGEKEMIYSIFQLDDTLARDIMIPRIDIVALEIDTPLAEAREVIIQAGHSRIPVYEESLDHVLGLLYAKDLLNVWHSGAQTFDMRSVLRPALFVPESKRVPDLLHELRNAKVHLAIVIDEYGGTAGLVTIEDIVEEIVGEILDEYDLSEEALFEMVGPDEFIFDARINLDDFNHLLDVSLPDEMGDTLGGFIYGELGKVPNEGEVIETNAIRLEVLRVIDRRIRKVRVKRSDNSAPSQNGKEKPRGSSNGH